MLRGSWLLTATWLFLAGTAGAARADFLTLTSSKDNTLIELPSSGSSPLSNGSGPSVFVGRTNQSPGNASRRGLIEFDLSSIAPGSQINSVSLTLWVTQGLNNQGQTISLFPLLAVWGEGSSSTAGGAGAPAAPPDATWFYAQLATNPWTTAGGDFGALASATATIAPGGTSLTWTGSGLVQDVQSWVDGTTANFGWLLRGNETLGGTARGFGTHENPNSALQPVLSIDYTPPVAVVPLPPGALLFGTGAFSMLLGARWRRRRVSAIGCA